MSAARLSFREFRSLVAPVVGLAAVSDMRPVLQRVAIAASGPWLVAQATDLVVAGFKRIPLGDIAAPGFAVVLSAVDVNQILQLFAPEDRADDVDLTIEVDEETGRVEVATLSPTTARGFAAAVVVFAAVESGPAFTDLSRLLPFAAWQQEGLVSHPSTVDEIGLNVHALARFRAAARYVGREQPLRVLMPTRPGLPVVVTVGHDFIGTIAPARSGERVVDVLATWAGVIPRAGIDAPAPVAEASEAAGATS